MMQTIRAIFYVTLLGLLASCGKQVTNIDQPPDPSTAFFISSSSMLDEEAAEFNAEAADFMVFDLSNTTNGVTSQVSSFASQLTNMGNPAIEITVAPDEVVSYAFFISPIGPSLDKCISDVESSVRSSCLTWGLLNVGSGERVISERISEQDATAMGADLISVQYRQDAGINIYNSVEGFAGIEPPASEFINYTLVGFALNRKLDVSNGSKDLEEIDKIQKIADFEEAFSGLVIAEDSINFTVDSKAFTLYNNDGTFSHNGGRGSLLNDTVITCGQSSASLGDSPFDNPGISPRLAWEDAPSAANAFMLFMMDDTSLESAGIYSTFLGDQDTTYNTVAGSLVAATYNSTTLTEPSESTPASTSFAVDCDFEHCRHWAVFNIPAVARKLEREEDFSSMSDVIQGKHLYHGAYYIQNQELGVATQVDSALSATITYTTNKGTLDTNFIATTESASPDIEQQTRGYFGPCAPVTSQGVRSSVRQYTFTLLPVRSELSGWITNAGTWSHFIQDLSLNNFLYYFSVNVNDKRRKRPGCPQSNFNCTSPYPTRDSLLAILNGDSATDYVLQLNATTTFYYADDDCELCRFCLIGYDAATPQVPLDAWKQFGHLY